ncbi:MAG: hypothetical protein MUO82_06910 [Candidatus Thermoplasmatota archaeon]|nr:hypothetical protein [Candidatus Thermoplasmatota archaeon]
MVFSTFKQKHRIHISLSVGTNFLERFDIDRVFVSNLKNTKKIRFIAKTLVKEKVRTNLIRRKAYDWIIHDKELYPCLVNVFWGDGR